MIINNQSQSEENLVFNYVDKNIIGYLVIHINRINYLITILILFVIQEDDQMIMTEKLINHLF